MHFSIAFIISSHHSSPNVADHLPGRPKALMDKWIRWFGTPS